MAPKEAYHRRACLATLGNSKLPRATGGERHCQRLIGGGGRVECAARLPHAHGEGRREHRARYGPRTDVLLEW